MFKKLICSFLILLVVSTVTQADFSSLTASEKAITRWAMESAKKYNKLKHGKSKVKVGSVVFIQKKRIDKNTEQHIYSVETIRTIDEDTIYENIIVRLNVLIVESNGIRITFPVILGVVIASVAVGFLIGSK